MPFYDESWGQIRCLKAINAPRRAARWGVLLAAALPVSACSSLGGEGSSPSLTLPAMPSLPSIGSISGASTADDAPIVGSATEIYARVARGANTCWFVGGGPLNAGPLKKAYIYHAEADAPSRGGKAEIVIHERDLRQPNPRGAKAYRVDIEPAGETATLKTENLKMPEPMAAAMTADVNRWAKGDQGCQGASTAAGWGAQAPIDPAAKPVATAAGKKAKSKVAAKTSAKPAAQPDAKTTAP